MAGIVEPLITVSVMLLMFGVGLHTPFAHVIECLRHVGPMVRGLSANFVAVPAVLYVLLLVLPVSPGVTAGIMVMAAAPLAPLALPMVRMAKGDVPYAVSLMTVAALLCVVITPVILAIAIPGGDGAQPVDPVEILRMLVIVQLVPIALGMGLLELRHDLATRIEGPISTVGKVGIVAGLVLVLVFNFEQLLTIDAIGHLVIALSVVFCLVIGDRAMADAPLGRRKSLAVCTLARNVALAVLIAGQVFPGTLAAPVIIEFALLIAVVAIVYNWIVPVPAPHN